MQLNTFEYTLIPDTAVRYIKEIALCTKGDIIQSSCFILQKWGYGMSMLYPWHHCKIQPRWTLTTFPAYPYDYLIHPVCNQTLYNNNETLKLDADISMLTTRHKAWCMVHLTLALLICLHLSNYHFYTTTLIGHFQPIFCDFQYIRVFRINFQYITQNL